MCWATGLTLLSMSVSTDVGMTFLRQQDCNHAWDLHLNNVGKINVYYFVVVQLHLSKTSWRGGWLINNSTSFVESIFSIEFMLMLENNNLDDRLISSPVQTQLQIIENNMELRWDEVDRQMTDVSHHQRKVWQKVQQNDPIELVIPLGKLLVKVYFKDKLWTFPHITVEEIHLVRALPG